MKKISKSDFFMVLSLILFVIVSYFTNYTSVFKDFDLNSVLFFHKIAVGHSLIVPKIITDLGYGVNISILLIILSVLLSYFRNYKEAILLNLTTNSALIASTFLKELFHRGRPALEYHLVKVSEYSFPSGHALIAVCFYGTLVFIIFRLVNNNRLKYLLLSILVLLIIFIGLSRVYFGVHYPTDVMGGFLLGIFINLFWIKIYNLSKK